MPAGVSTALFIVVFGSDTAVTLAHDPEAASALEATAVFAAKATDCTAGGTNVLATTSVVIMGATTIDRRGRISFCNIAKCPTFVMLRNNSFDQRRHRSTER
jgi:hypothetical protein